MREIEFMAFTLGEHRYGIPTGSMQELLRAVNVVPLPAAPRIIEGVINLRGALVPVLDIRARFKLPAKPLELSDHLAVVTASGRRVALRLDRAIGLLRIPAHEVESGDAFDGSEYVAGIAKLADGLVLIHDPDTFLSEAECRHLDESLLPGPGP